MPTIPSNLFNELMAIRESMFQPKYEGVPSNNPAQAQTVVDMFGKLYGSPEDEVARLAAEKQYDYAMAEAQAQARLANPRFGGYDTPERINAELFGPLNARWNPQPSKVVKAEAPRAWHVGNSLLMETPEGVKEVYKGSSPTVPTTTVSFTPPGSEGKVTKKMTQTEYEDYLRNTSKVAELTDEYNEHKNAIASGDFRYGFANTRSRETRMKEIEKELRAISPSLIPAQPAQPAPFAPPPNSSLTNTNLPRILSIRQR